MLIDPCTEPSGLMIPMLLSGMSNLSYLTKT